LLPYPHPSSKGFVPEGASTLNRFDWSVNERERGEEKRREREAHDWLVAGSHKYS